MDLAGISDETPNLTEGRSSGMHPAKPLVCLRNGPNPLPGALSKYLDGISDEEKAAKWLKVFVSLKKIA